MTTQDVANRFYELSQTGRWDLIQDELYSQNAVSIEPEHSPAMRTVKGVDTIVKKGHDFQAMVEKVHSNVGQIQLCPPNNFNVATLMDVDFKGMGRQKMDEVAVYQVKDGKEVQEQFFY